MDFAEWYENLSAELGLAYLQLVCMQRHEKNKFSHKKEQPDLTLAAYAVSHLYQ